MKKTISRRFTAELALFMGLIFAVFTSFARFDAACDEFRRNVLRFTYNRKFKFPRRIRRSNFWCATEYFERDNGYFHGRRRALPTQKKKKAAERIGDIAEYAAETLEENGFGYGATAEIGNSYFETREYETFTLPAGNCPLAYNKARQSRGQELVVRCFFRRCVFPPQRRGLNYPTAQAKRPPK